MNRFYLDFKLIIYETIVTYSEIRHLKTHGIEKAVHLTLFAESGANTFALLRALRCGAAHYDAKKAAQ